MLFSIVPLKAASLVFEKVMKYLEGLILAQNERWRRA